MTTTLERVDDGSATVEHVWHLGSATRQTACGKWVDAQALVVSVVHKSRFPTGAHHPCFDCSNIVNNSKAAVG